MAAPTETRKHVARLEVSRPLSRPWAGQKRSLANLAQLRMVSRIGRCITWKVKRCIWNGLIVQKFRFSKPRRAPVPTDATRKVRRIPLVQRYRSIPISNVFVAARIPADENEILRLFACKIQAQLYRFFPPKGRDLASIDSDPETALAHAYTQGHERQWPAPEMPEEYQCPIDLGQLAVAGPYFCYLQRSPEGGYEWDLQELGDYECHQGLRKLGVRVLFSVNETTRCLVPVRIDCELGTCTPSNSNWQLSQKIALCAATTHLNIVRHFTGIHLALVGQFAIATRNTLPADHSVRRLLWPHTWGAQYSNELITQLFMMQGGDFEEIFSFTHAGLCKLVANTYQKYDIRVIDPLVDVECRGISKGELDLPALENRLAHLDVFLSHTRRYLSRYYGCDQDVQNDIHIQEWVNELNRLIPGGVDRLLGNELGIEVMAKFIAAFIYAGTVEHEILGSGLWDYQLWTHVQPVRVYEDGRREPIDLYQRLVNYSFMFNVSRARLLQDLSDMALDAAGKEAFNSFLAELVALQKNLDAEDPGYWKISPRILEVSVNG